PPDTSRQLAQLEALLSTPSVSPEEILTQCDALRTAAATTPAEEHLRRIEAAALERKKARDEELRARRAVEDARALLEAKLSPERRREVASLLTAARKAGGSIAEEAELLLRKLEKIPEADLPPPPEPAKPAVPENPPPSAEPSLEPITCEFQDGVLPNPAYAGTRDAVIQESIPTQCLGTQPGLFVDGDYPNGSTKDRYILIRWDLSKIPPGSRPLSAQLTFTVTATETRQKYGIYALRRPWTETEVTWNQAAGGRPWQIPGAQGESDRGPTRLGTFTTPGMGSFVMPLNAEGLKVLRSWIDDPLSNHGFLIGDPQLDDGTGVASREHPTAAWRPKLTLQFIPAAEPVLLALSPANSVPQWLLVGPFKTPTVQGGLKSDFLQGEDRHVPRIGAHAGGSPRLRWTPSYLCSDVLLLAEQPGFDSWNSSGEPAVAYAACWLHSEKETAVTIRVAADAAHQTWLNHQRIGVQPRPRGLTGEEDAYRVRLKAGPNLLLVKAVTAGETFALKVRITSAVDRTKAPPGIRVGISPPVTDESK
ncbi:MAG: DNRLRE domain-containing protein, partial [Planctomycetota bacterium]